MQGDPLELERDVQQRVVLGADLVQHLMAGLLHDFRARIVVLIDPVAEPHQPKAVVRVFGPADVLWDAFGFADFAQHVQRSFVGAAMGWPPQTRTAGRDAGEGIGARGTGEPDR